MDQPLVTDSEARLLDELVAIYEADLPVFEALATQILSVVRLPPLPSLYHSLLWRVKDPQHLRDKLKRKLLEAKNQGNDFDITATTLFARVNDLVGVRLLHLHTTQFEEINRVLLGLLDEHGFAIAEGPEARTWDDEYRAYFERIGVRTLSSESMYTSVHYVITPNRRTTRTAEIQVRTLAEELWGEVDHSINYPEECRSLACREQIRVLARVTSSCTRLVDAIFATNQEDKPGASVAH